MVTSEISCHASHHGLPTVDQAVHIHNISYNIHVHIIYTSVGDGIDIVVTSIIISNSMADRHGLSNVYMQGGFEGVRPNPPLCLYIELKKCCCPSVTIV